ncbi:MAG: acyl-CoA dehydratase activase [Lachnospiraceae bacterium]|nr:acyl-CoA dehydratase activase [Lachnospiraceae bacterium]
MKYSIGIDSGSTTTKGVLYDGVEIVKQVMIPTTAKPRMSIQEVYRELYTEGVKMTVTTGYGRKLLSEADRSFTEITCHGAGAGWLKPGIGGVIDIGGQDCKAILLNSTGQVVDFMMNDKCAAGTGRFVEVMMRILEQPIEALDSFVEGREIIPINSMCTVFAESEIISLLAEEKDPGGIALGVLHSICKRTAFFAQKLPMKGEIFFTGGLTRSKAFCEILSRYMGKTLITHEDAPLAGAIGAAILGYARIRD